MALAAPLYIFMLVDALSVPGAVGDARMGEAFEALLVTAGLWLVLAAMVIAGGIMGSMPRWAAVAAVLLLPLSGIAAFVAIDMCSRNMRWAAAFPALLPLVIASCAYWARSKRLHEVLPPRQASLLGWGAVVVLSLLPMMLAAVY